MINYNVDSDGIATITWDMPGRTMNVLNEASMTAYTGALEEAIKDDKVKGIILTSAKADFIAGADLEMLLGTDTSDAAKLMDYAFGSSSAGTMQLRTLPAGAQRD